MRRFVAVLALCTTSFALVNWPSSLSARQHVRNRDSSLGIFKKLQSFFFPEPSPAYDAPYKLSESEWKGKLQGESYYVLRQAGTEYAFSSPLNDEKRSGAFKCKGCGQELFSSSAKFNSGTGWPSYFKPVNEGAVVERKDGALGMTRTEVLCSNCGGHLGHVFPDGPRPTGLRYCINGVSLTFAPSDSNQADNLKNLK